MQKGGASAPPFFGQERPYLVILAPFNSSARS
jgi:hypothetical protein